MTKQQERIIKTSRESPLGCGFWLKVCFTFGLYLIWWHAKRLIVTNRRVIRRSGVLGRAERSIPLSRVQDVSIRYNPIGRLPGYGNVRIESAGGRLTEIVAYGISDPQGVRDAIIRQVK